MSTDRKAVDHNNAMMSCRAMLGPPAALNTVTPCAACKLLRRRCAQECPFSPYFSPREPQKFASVHKIFGASNVSKMLMEVPESQRADAANCLVYEAIARLRDPVYGCVGDISSLQRQAQSLQAELNAVRAEIMRYKCRDQSPPAQSMQSGAFVFNSNNIITTPASDSDDSPKVASPTSTVTSAHTKQPYWSVLGHNSR